MSSETYSFITRWELDAPKELVWSEISNCANWPSWWPEVKAVELLAAGDQDEIGKTWRYKWQSPFFYKLSVTLCITDIQPLQSVSALATGDLEGTGEWQFSCHDTTTVAICSWKVRTRIPWMNRMAFLLKPLFRYNHRLIMRSGLQGLKQAIEHREKT